MYRALWYRRHSGATRIRQCTRRYAPRAPVHWLILVSPSHRAVSGEGITYYPRQKGGAWKAHSDGFVSNCPASNVPELVIATHVISNNTTACMEL